MQMANLEGGNDNITVQVATIPGEPPQEKARTTEVIVTPELHDRGGPPWWVWAAGVVLAGALLWLLLGSR